MSYYVWHFLIRARKERRTGGVFNRWIKTTCRLKICAKGVSHRRIRDLYLVWVYVKKDQANPSFIKCAVEKCSRKLAHTKNEEF